MHRDPWHTCYSSFRAGFSWSLFSAYAIAPDSAPQGPSRSSAPPNASTMLRAFNLNSGRPLDAAGCLKLAASSGRPEFKLKARSIVEAFGGALEQLGPYGA